MALLLSPSRASLVDIEMVKVDEKILMVCIVNFAVLFITNELKALLCCVKTPAVELQEPAAIEFCY